MGYVFDYKDAKDYHQWLQDSRAQIIIDLESRLMLNLLQPRQDETVLDIGCGSGLNLGRPD